jgi:methanogenic corrinoid protein MtbC1
VPLVALAGAAARHEADVVCLTATMAETGARLAAVMEQVGRVRPRATFLLGGSGLPSGLRERPGIAVCGRVSGAVEAADALVQRSRMN